MSNYLAIATATATLRQLLHDGASHDVPGARVTMTRPDALEGAVTDPSINVYLYQVSPNPAWRNADLPTRRADGQLAQRPRAALDLHYLLTFYGDDEQLEPQRLLGSAVRTLHTQPMLSRDGIERTVASTDVLAESDLAREVELVKLTPMAFSLEELSKLWSVFFQTPYTLSMAYQGTVVFVEGEDPGITAYPVLERTVLAVPIKRPMIERAESARGPREPITADRQVVIVGERLRGDHTQVFVDETEVEPLPLTAVTDRRITIDLPSTLRAGVHAVQVLHALEIGNPKTPHGGMESNTAAFVLRPKLFDSTGAFATTALAPDSDGFLEGTITVVEVKPAIAAGQPVTLLMNLVGRGEITYRFPAPLLERDAVAVTVPVRGLEAGRYLVRLRVGRTESPLELDKTPGAFARPFVDVA
jgi:hypothetical protein